MRLISCLEGFVWEDKKACNWALEYINIQWLGRGGGGAGGGAGGGGGHPATASERRMGEMLTWERAGERIPSKEEARGQQGQVYPIAQARWVREDVLGFSL